MESSYLWNIYIANDKLPSEFSGDNANSLYSENTTSIDQFFIGLDNNIYEIPINQFDVKIKTFTNELYAYATYITDKSKGILGTVKNHILEPEP